MRPRLEKRKIAIKESTEVKSTVSDSSITWFSNAGEAKGEEFDYIIDAGNEDFILIHSAVSNPVPEFLLKPCVAGDKGAYLANGSQENKIYFVSGEKDILLKQLVSLLVDEQIVDIDDSFIHDVWKTESHFASFLSGVEDVIDKSISWVQDTFSKECEKILVYIVGDISLLDIDSIWSSISDTVDTVNAEVWAMHAACYDEKEQGVVRVSAWYR